MRQLTLYSYFRSSAAYRVRIALGLKGVPFATEPVNLLKDGGQQRSAAYAAINPQMRVPSLRIDDEGVSHVLIQSPAILEWIEETFPEPPLLPREPLARAHARAIAAKPSWIHFAYQEPRAASSAPKRSESAASVPELLSG